ncbi:hypothetical protein D9V86_02985 [Bacteroidetes/Chlorobi group bacterium ChocPot_Mid]|nr:MAG: hypothetical protein D9V86_02985 [Bacteroidetes/Chlorobi group bacterium ChocPot_Mid]
MTRAIRDLSSVDDEKKKKSLIQKSNEILSELIDENLHIEKSETTIELNFALIKVKHTKKNW